MNKKLRVTELIKQKALELGFADCGIAQAKCLPTDAEFLHKWLEKMFQKIKIF